MINEYCGADYANRLVLNAGIGATYMNCRGAAPSGNETRQTSIDSTANITQIFPAVNLGLEYAAYKTEHFSVGFGLSIRYNLLFEAKNNYYITVSEPGNKIYDYTTNLSGQLVTPGLYVAAHYNIHSKK